MLGPIALEFQAGVLKLRPGGRGVQIDAGLVE